MYEDRSINLAISFWKLTGFELLKRTKWIPNLLDFDPVFLVYYFQSVNLEISIRIRGKNHLDSKESLWGFLLVVWGGGGGNIL